MDRLEDRGLACRDRRSDDRRVVRAMLTPAGRELIAEILPVHVDYLEHLARHLTTEERETMGTLLRRLEEGITDSDP